MEKVKFEVGHEFDTNDGKKILCYEVTDMFAFMAPVEKTEEETILKVGETLVYNREVSEEVVSPIKGIALPNNNTEEKAE